MNTIVKVKGDYDFQKELDESRKRLAYYEEGLFIEVAARIIEAMENRGITRSGLARQLNVSPAYITKILRGHANLSLESLAKVAFALDLKWELNMLPIEAGSNEEDIAFAGNEPLAVAVGEQRMAYGNATDKSPNASKCRKSPQA